MGFKIEKYNMWSIFLLGIYFSYLNRGFFFDDALIYARYINNLLDGKGLVYNAGEYFNGLTSPLFTYISIAISYITKDVIFSINFLSGFFLLLSLFFIGKNFTFSNKSNGWTVFWGLLLIVSSPYTYSIFGMETLLFIFLINLCIYFF
jgi:hypothetical protein